MCFAGVMKISSQRKVLHNFGWQSCSLGEAASVLLNTFGMCGEENAPLPNTAHALVVFGYGVADRIALCFSRARISFRSMASGFPSDDRTTRGIERPGSSPVSKYLPK